MSDSAPYASPANAGDWSAAGQGGGPAAASTLHFGVDGRLRHVARHSEEWKSPTVKGRWKGSEKVAGNGSDKVVEVIGKARGKAIGEGERLSSPASCLSWCRGSKPHAPMALNLCSATFRPSGPLSLCLSGCQVSAERWYPCDPEVAKGQGKAVVRQW